MADSILTPRSWDALLAGAGLPRLDARALLESVSGHSREWLLAHGDEPVPAEVQSRFETLAARRRHGEPLAYLLEWREFLGRRFRVDADVLVPRPETEGLIETALGLLNAMAQDGRPADPPLRAIDLGTGSGVIAISLSLARPDLQLSATDASPKALAVARGNAQALGTAPIRWHLGDWWSAVPPDEGLFDLVVSNPPYLADDDAHLLDPALAHEPRMALACGPRGMEAIETITAGAIGRLSPGGWLAFEHGADQGATTRACLLDAGFQEVSTRSDLAGLDRITLGRRP